MWGERRRWGVRKISHECEILDCWRLTIILCNLFLPAFFSRNQGNPKSVINLKTKNSNDDDTDVMWKRCNATIQFCRVELRRGTYSLQDTKLGCWWYSLCDKSQCNVVFELNDKFQFMPDLLLVIDFENFHDESDASVPTYNPSSTTG